MLVHFAASCVPGEPQYQATCSQVYEMETQKTKSWRICVATYADKLRMGVVPFDYVATEHLMNVTDVHQTSGDLPQPEPDPPPHPYDQV